MQVSSEAMSSCVTTTLRVVTLGADEEFKQEATQDKSDRSKGEVDYEKLKPMFHLSWWSYFLIHLQPLCQIT